MASSAIDPADTSSERPSDAATADPGRGKPAWRRSIGGKFLIAFGLIAALTVGRRPSR